MHDRTQRPQTRRHAGRGGHHRDDFGFGPGYNPWFGPRGGRGGRRRMRRGDVRAAILLLLSEEPRNGYQLMKEIEERSEGAWRPSPGSVYPALQQLEDEGLVVPEKIEGRKHFKLTEDGAKYVDENAEKLGEPWKDLTPDENDARRALANQIKPLMAATGQLMQAGGDDGVRRGAELLAETRRKIYAILAEDDTENN